jgi:hypothetical protein
MFPIGSDTFPTPSKQILAHTLLLCEYIVLFKMNDFSDILSYVDWFNTHLFKYPCWLRIPLTEIESVCWTHGCKRVHNCGFLRL